MGLSPLNTGTQAEMPSNSLKRRQSAHRAVLTPCMPIHAMAPIICHGSHYAPWLLSQSLDVLLLFPVVELFIGHHHFIVIVGYGVCLGSQACP